MDLFNFLKEFVDCLEDVIDFLWDVIQIWSNSLMISRANLMDDIRVSEGFPAGYAIDEDAAVHFIDQDVHKVVSSRENALAYYVEMQNSSIVEKKLETQIIQ